MAQRKKKKSWGEAPALCNTLSPDQDALTGEIVTRIAEKWCLWAMSVLALAGNPLRFSRVMEQVKGVSQKSLTKTLRALERDGLVTRRLFAESRPAWNTALLPSGRNFWNMFSRSGFGWRKVYADSHMPAPTSTTDNENRGAYELGEFALGMKANRYPDPITRCLIIEGCRSFEAGLISSNE